MLFKLILHMTERMTLYVLLKDPKPNNGYISGTKVGVAYDFDLNREPMFKAVDPVEFTAGGCAWTLEEFKGQLK